MSALRQGRKRKKRKNSSMLLFGVNPQQKKKKGKNVHCSGPLRFRSEGGMCAKWPRGRRRNRDG